MSEHPILGQIALAYSPVIDRNRAVIATRLTVFPLQQGSQLDAGALLQAIAEVWPTGGASQVWLNVLSENLLEGLMQAQPATHVFIEIPAFMAGDASHVQAITTLHANGNTLLLKGRPLQELPREVLPCFKYAIVDLSDDRRVDETAANASGVTRTVSHVQNGVTNVADMEAAFRRGATAVLGWPIDDAIQSGARKAEQPSLQAIVMLIDQVHKEADIEDLEGTLKRDPALAYKLLRYINSPAFGLSVEISSFRHAIMVLGYQRLKRWLALLLATASKDPNMRPVMFAAVRRGLLMEEISRGSSDEMRSELFICGVFSLLDRMFNQPFSELLKTIPVPERVFQALVDGTGPYEPYFRMIKAIEGTTLDEIREASDGLMMAQQDINSALLKAIAAASQLD
ncbi:MAG TPA: HDOD domain-containing protein [Candidatus Aquabacterium excrementipullorum]|nr:HDOD domain-containing protein [Candidatus Aquabacterium excrementipullorum]